MTDRPSTGTRATESRWRSVIRVFAVIVAVLGLILVSNEILEQVTCHSDLCPRMHLSTMLWGLTLLSLGLLILQKGDVSLSIKEFAETGTVVRGWWLGRRAGDKIPVVIVPPPPVTPKPTEDKG